MTAPLAGPLTVLVFGATGTAGGSVLRACLASPEIGEVRAIVRRPLALQHAKLRVTLHDDYLAYDAVRAAFRGVDACYFCLGISVYQVPDEAAYRRITQLFPLAAARVLREESPRAQFHYLSGGNASLTSRAMWARVKAEAERDLIQRAPHLSMDPPPVPPVAFGAQLLCQWQGHRPGDDPRNAARDAGPDHRESGAARDRGRVHGDPLIPPREARCERSACC